MYLGIPALLAYLLHGRFGNVGHEQLPTFLAVYGILAAVVVGLLPLVYTIIGQTDTSREYTPGQRPLAERELTRIYTLQDLYSTISYSTFLLVVSIFCCIMIGIMPSDTATQADWMRVLIAALSGTTYFVGVSTAISILDVGNGVFDAMNDQVDAAEQEIHANCAPDAADEDEVMRS